MKDDTLDFIAQMAGDPPPEETAKPNGCWYPACEREAVWSCTRQDFAVPVYYCHEHKLLVEEIFVGQFPDVCSSNPPRWRRIKR